MLKLVQIIWCGLRGSPSRALRGLYWYLAGKRVRGLNLIKSAAARSPSYYQLWIAICEPRLIESYCLADAAAPRLAVVATILQADSNPQGAERTRGALRAAFGTDLMLVDGCDPETLSSLLSRGAWLLPIMAGDLVSSKLSGVLASAVTRHPAARILFWDEDQFDQSFRSAPWVKAEWDEDLFLSRDGLTSSAAYLIGRELAGTVEGEIGQLLLAAIISTREFGTVAHIPLILSHRAPAGCIDELAERARMLTQNWPGHPEFVPGPDGRDVLETIWPVATWPAVSIIIPTRDRLDLLQTCIAGISKLEYPGCVELIIADNSSEEPETLAYFNEFSNGIGKVIDCAGPFNFSTIVNRAATQAGGQLLCLLNNDVEPLDGTWLERLVRQAVRPGVGAVGAMLLYPDGSIQHAGVALGVGGAAGHIYRSLRPELRGNGSLHCATRRVSIVTAACLLIQRDHFFEVGGFDEAAFAVAFNDVDFCLRLEAIGLRNIYVAEARLIHAESKSRGNDMLASNIARYRSELGRLQHRWGTQRTIDPWHSPLIGRAAEDFVLEFDARSRE